ncbi:ABC transporter substrate-binding protein [Nocardioides lianchengensis]|uniref:ABC-type nitrate/sulfonate/bicarbonate transport system, substrate-binding protein n=1 Tax=Nocardioides lianchengensis TaxID=1045774 RepID=A0A1G6V2N2_9ACTN|nr:ABC transporter substrate-binding protein [Nocardioides lianchengensis]NYG11100.1 ABC-type nitrate/sulfonate/bicarbonate transport system substrate-binding protein [Nocardioides lianchengensis]SDD47196.1 ABC-type nitrate/sulfonate/bicarbonate transport system, substrate-binding protein [Nocardioides lianchengensis]
MAALPRARRLSARRSTIAASAVSLVAVLALAGCGSDDSSSTDAGGDGGGDASYGEIDVQYSWIKNEEFSGEFYAYENGYYDEAGFDAVNGISGPDTGVAKLLSGTVDVAINDAASVGAAIAEEEAPLKIVGATFQKNPFTILSLKDGADIATPQDLVGKKIGVQDSNANVFRAILAANDIDEKDVEVVPVDFDPTPLMNKDVDGFMAYLTNEALTVELAGYEITNLPYAENGVPYVAETFTVTDQTLAEDRDKVKAFLTAEIKGWSDVFQQPTDATVDLITKYYNEAASDNAEGLESVFGALDPKKTGMGLEASKLLISTPDTEANGLFTITDELQSQTVESLAAAGWEVSVEDLFDTSLIDEIYEENPDLKAYQG